MSVMVCVVEVDPSVAISIVAPAPTATLLPRVVLVAFAPADDWVTVMVCEPSARSFDEVRVDTPSAEAAETR